MKCKTYLLNTLLVAVFGTVLLVEILLRTFVPGIILPQGNIPNLVLVSLVALVLDHYIAPDAQRCYFCVAGFAALTFGLLPFAGGFVTGLEALKLALAGGVVFTAVTFLYTLALDRISSGPSAKAAPVVTALGLYLAAQCFAGIFL